MEEKETQYAEIVKRFGFVLSQYRLYSEMHPSAQLAVRNFLETLEQVSGSESSLTLGFVGERLLVNDHPLGNKKIGVADLLREGHRFHIDSLIFSKGASEDEIVSFFKVMAIPPKILEARGGFRKAFEEADFQHVRLGTSRYKMVKEEEEVVHKSEIGAGGSEGEKKEKPALNKSRKIERMEDFVEHLLKGPQGKVELEIDIGRLAYEVEKKPEAVAREMLRAEDLETLKRVVDDLGRFLQEQLARPLMQEGKDFSPRISRFAKEFKKTVESSDAPAEFKGAIEDLVATLEKYADEVKLELITKTFLDSGRDVSSLEKIAAKFLRSKDAREKIMGPLRERLSDLGLGEKEFEQVFSTLEEKRAPRKSRQSDVSPEELEELRQIRDRFEEEVAHRVQVQTASLERGMRRALDEKERVDTIIRNLGEGLVVVDVEGKIQVMNPAAEKLLGLNQAKGKGVPIPQVLKDEHLLALAKGPLHDEGDRVTKQIELRSVNDETRRVLQASTAVIENENGKTVGMVSVLSDITQQKKLDEAKSKFVSHVSHELRTPLVAIDESLAILLREETGTINPGQEKFLSIARRNISRLSRLVNDLLDVAKLEAGKLEMRPISFQIRDMVHHVVETVRGWASDRQVNIEEKYPEADVVLEADADRLIQVVTNLLGNAIKFTPEEGKILVEVATDWTDPEISSEPCVAISVQDSGIGIPKEDQQRIFQKFEQVSLASPGGVSSTGLGLTIAKEIVALHGGKIWVDSNEGEGSRFTFAIPRRLRNEARTEQ